MSSMVKGIRKKPMTSKDDRVINTVVTVLSLLAALVVIYPLLFVVSASVSEPLSVVAGEVTLFPVGFTLGGYKRILEYQLIWIGYRNTIFYTVLGMAVTLVATLPAAYALSRNDLKGRGFFTTFFAITMFFNAGLIPT